MYAKDFMPNADDYNDADADGEVRILFYITLVSCELWILSWFSPELGTLHK